MKTINKWAVFPITQWLNFKSEWDSLNSRISASPLLCSRFVETCLDHFGTGLEQLALYRGFNGQLQAATIGLPRGPGQWTVLQIPQAPLAFWLSEPDATFEELVSELAHSLRRRIMVISVPQLDPSINPTPPESPRLRIDPYIDTARIEIDQPWEVYWGSRSKNLRSNHRKAKRRAEDAGIELRLVSSTEPAAVESAVTSFGSLEEHSWKADGGTAVSPSNKQGQFYRALLASMAAAGNARAYTLLAGNRPAAVDLCVKSDTSLIVLKTTYSLEFKDLSPASLLREMYLSEIFAEPGLASIEFYGRVMDWHLRWTNDIRTIYHTTFFRSPILRRAIEFIQNRERIRR